jgi:electron transfer flavoprotein alpha subunit
VRPRRDPRAERERHRLAAGAAGSGAATGSAAARPRFTIEVIAATASGRPRRDPRAEEAAALIPGGRRRRLDRTQRLGHAAAAAAPSGAAMPAPSAGSATTAPVAAAVRIIAEPAFLVLVVPDAAAGRISAHDRQLLGAGRILADAGGGAVAVLGEGGEDWGAMGVDREVRIPAAGEDRVGGSHGRGVEVYDPEARAAAVAAAIRALSARHVLFPESADGGDLARRVAARLGEPLFAGAESVSARAVTRPARAGRVEQRAAPPRLVSLAADVVAEHAGARHEARPIEIEAAAAAERRIRSAELIPADPAAVPLSEATFVVSAGNGVTDFDAFRRLVAALGATAGASRVVCDAGLMPRDRQVGASGTVLDAACYFALGIAGAPQHLQGVAKCEHVVAVNTDLHAAMIERAGLAIVADAQTVMPAILAALAAEAPEKAGEGGGG